MSFIDEQKTQRLLQNILTAILCTPSYLLVDREEVNDQELKTIYLDKGYQIKSYFTGKHNTISEALESKDRYIQLIAFG